METSDQKSQWMSIGQAAEYLGISRDTLRRWEKRGKIKAIRSPTNRRYYTRQQLETIMEGKESKVFPFTKKPSKPKAKLKISKRQQLIIISTLSFIVAATSVLLLKFFLLK